MLVALLFIVFLLPCGCLCFVSLPHCAVGWSVIVAFPGLVTGHTLLNYWYNFGRGYYGKNLCEINLN